MGGSRGRMSQHDEIGAHRLNIARGIEKRFTLDHAARRSREIDDVCAQTLGCELERRAGPRAGLEEEIDHGLAAQRRDLLDITAGNFFERIGGLEDQSDFFDREVPHSQQVFALQTHGEMITTRSGSPVSSRKTSTCSFSAVGRFLPTYVALMGNCRCPRSTSTAN